MMLLLSNWVSYHDQRNLQTHHTILATLLIYLPWLVVCVVHPSSFITDGTFNTEKWLAILTLLLPGIDRVIILQLQPSSQSSNQPIMVGCIAHYHHLDNQWHCKSDWHVSLDYCIASYCEYSHIRWVSSQLRTSYAFYCMGVRPNKSATIDIIRLLF